MLYNWRKYKHQALAEVRYPDSYRGCLSLTAVCNCRQSSAINHTL